MLKEGKCDHNAASAKAAMPPRVLYSVETS